MMVAAFVCLKRAISFVGVMELEPAGRVRILVSILPE